jgi:uncharacterized protein involved in exopolysaccharide biosynthesis
VEDLVARYGTSDAGRQRVFVAGQLSRAQANLVRDEEKLRRFQEANRAIVLQDQTRGAIEAAAQLKAQIMASEVQVQVMRSIMTDTNPDVIMLRQRIAEIKRQLDQLQYGNGVPRSGPRPATSERPDFHVPFVNVPELGLELVRLTRDVKIQEALVTLLTQQLEQAKIAEAKDLPIVRTLDEALPPEQPATSSLVLLLGFGSVSGVFFGVILVFTLEYFNKLRRLPRHV